MMLGAGAIAYSLLTDYEPGAVRVIPRPIYLGIDVMSGLLLMATSWLFAFAGHIRPPRVLLGAVGCGAALMTRTVSERTVGGLHAFQRPGVAELVGPSTDEPTTSGPE